MKKTAEIKYARFDIYDERTIQRLQDENPGLLPRPKVNQEKNNSYIESRVSGATMAGILNGDDIPTIAQRIMDSAVGASEASAVRMARTAMTSAQNGGRQAAYRDLQSKVNVPLSKQWMAAGDDRTRPTHMDADGQIVPVGKFFTVGHDSLEYPADSRGSGEEVYNCRCTMGMVVDGANSSSAQRYRLNSERRFSGWVGEKQGKTLKNTRNYGKIELKQKIGIQFFANSSIETMTDNGLRKSMRKWAKRISEHEMKIENPEKYDVGWFEKDEVRKAGLIRHWKHEIKTFKDNMEQATKEMQKRGIL